MCGIVGILGRAPVAEQLVDSLKRLEYRGYDSAGVATLEGNKLERRRAEGKLKNLEARLAAKPLAGHSGIGHTRWATHGRPTENNAHPHATERVAVVHNGIIENFRELREALEKKGAVFKTETDTEIVLHLVDDMLRNGVKPVEAGRAALTQLRGAVALGFIFAGAAGSGRPHAGALCRHGDRAGDDARKTAVRFQGYPARLDRRLRHRELCRLCRQILAGAARTAAGRNRCRLGIPLPRGALAQGR